MSLRNKEDESCKIVSETKDKIGYRPSFALKAVPKIASQRQLPKISKQAEILSRTPFARNSSWGAVYIFI